LKLDSNNLGTHSLLDNLKAKSFTGKASTTTTTTNYGVFPPFLVDKWMETYAKLHMSIIPIGTLLLAACYLTPPKFLVFNKYSYSILESEIGA